VVAREVVAVDGAAARGGSAGGTLVDVAAEGVATEGVLAVGSIALDATAAGAATAGLGCQSVGGTTCTMLPHLGQAMIMPTTEASLTFSRARQVVQWMLNSSTERGPRVLVKRSGGLASRKPVPV